MKNFIIAALGSIFIMISLTGCDFKDIDRRIFIVALGIDGDPNDADILKISFKAAMPGSVGETSGPGSNSQQNNTDIYTVSGNSISEILRTLKSRTSMEPDFSHMKVIIFGKEYAESHDISDIEDFFVRRRDIQEMAWICLGMPSAKEVLSIIPKEEKIPGNGFFMKFGQGSTSPYAYKTKSYEFYSDIITPGSTPSCPVMEIKDGKLNMSQIAIFSDFKLGIILNEQETQLVNLLTEGINYGSFSAQIAKKDKPLSISIDKGKSKIKLKKNPNGDEIICTINIKIDGTLELPNGFSGDFQNVTPEFEEVLNKQVTTLLDKLKKYNLDPLRLEIRYWSSSVEFTPTNAWLTDMLPNIKVVVNSNINISDAGIIDLR